MPQSYFFFTCFSRRDKFSYLITIAIAMFACTAHGAEWRECEKAKLRELQLQRGASDQKSAKRKSRSQGESRRQRAEEIDTWLWKNCREYSYELRQLEQEKM